MLRIDSVLTGPGGPYFNSLYFESESALAAEAAADAVVGMWTAAAGSLNGEISAEVLPEVPVVDPATGQATSYHAVTGGTVEMSGTGQPLPFTTQGLIRWQTGNVANGRRIRGRLFVPGFDEEASTGGVPGSSAVNVMTTMAQVLLNDFPDAGPLVVFSRTNGVAAVVTGFSVWTQWASLRSRRPGE